MMDARQQFVVQSADHDVERKFKEYTECTEIMRGLASTTTELELLVEETKSMVQRLPAVDKVGASSLPPPLFTAHLVRPCHPLQFLIIHCSSSSGSLLVSLPAVHATHTQPCNVVTPAVPVTHIHAVQYCALYMPRSPHPP